MENIFFLNPILLKQRLVAVIIYELYQDIKKNVRFKKHLKY